MRCLDECDLAPCQRYRAPSDYGLAYNDRRSGPGIRRGSRGPSGGGGGPQGVPDLGLYGLRGFSAADYMQSAVNGGEAGISTGFGEFVEFRLDALPATAQMLGASANGAGGTRGYQLYISATAALTAACSNGAGTAFVNAPTRQFLASDIGKVFVACVYLDGAGQVRMWCSRAQSGNGTATTGYTPDTAPRQWQGTIAGGSPATAVTIFASATFRGTPSDVQIQAYFDASRALGDLPDTIDGATVTHLWSVKRELAGTAIVNGQVAPASLTDRITGAAADVMTTVGTGLTVVKRDPSIDGRRTYGAQGWSAANYMQTANGLAGALTGHWLSWFGVINSAPGALSCLVGKRNSAGGQQGFDLLINGTNVYFEQVNTGASAIPNVNTPLTSAMLGVPKVVTGVFTGTTGATQNVLQLYVDGVPLGGNVTCVGLTPATVPYRVGLLGDGTVIANTTSWFGDAGGIGVPTAQQVLDHATATLAASRMQSIPGLTTILHDPSQDTVASGNLTVVPATILDRVGTDNLTRVDAIGVSSGAIRVGANASTECLRAAVGLRGQVGSCIAWMGRLETLSTTGVAAILVECTDGSTRGFSLQAGAINYGSLRIAAYATGGAFIVSSSINATGNITAGQTIVLLGVITAGGQLQFFLNGVQVGANVAITGYAAPAATDGFYVGARAGSSFVAQNASHLGITGGNFTPSSADALAHYNACIAAGSIVAIPNGTALKTYDFKAAITAASGTLPGAVPESVSGGDNLARQGSPLTLAQRVERLWSYETSPIMYGGQTWTDSDYYSVTTGFTGSMAGYWISALVMITSQAITSGTHIFASKADSITGWDLRTNGTNSTFQFVHRDGAGTAITSSVGVVLASDVGKLHLFTGCYDPSIGKVRGFWKRAELSQVAATAGFTPSTYAMALGRYNLSAPGFSAPGLAILGFAAGNSVPTLAEHQAQYDACMSNERMTAIPGKTSILYDLTIEGGVPASLTDRIGTQHMTKTGSPVLLSQYARAWGV